MFHLSQLVEGKVYRFVFKRQSGNYRWYEVECQAVFIGTRSDYRPGGEIVISSRPQAGTGFIPINNIVSAELVGRPDQWGSNIRLPKQRPGAVTAPTMEV